MNLFYSTGHNLVQEGTSNFTHETFPGPYESSTQTQNIFVYHYVAQ
jgi:hypothetical protein